MCQINKSSRDQDVGVECYEGKVDELKYSELRTGILVL